MDNQQERFSDGVKMGYLVCAIESEGHVSLSWGRNGKRRVPQIIPRVAVANSIKGYIEYLLDISQEFGIGCHIEQDFPNRFSPNPNRCKMYRIIWYGFKRVKAMLDKIMPFMIIKKERAQIVRDFITYRESLEKANQPYGQIEFDLFLKIREMNGTKRELPKHIEEYLKKSSETNTLNARKSEDRVQLVSKDMR